jgi:hypothetical protein
MEAGMYFAQRHLPWVASLVVGLLLLGSGAVMVQQGLATRHRIQTELRDEQVMTASDTPRPGVLVDDAATAEMQSEAIKHHTLGTWGPYSQLPRDDPRRAQFIDGVALRTALNMAVMGLGITDLLVGAGLIVVLAGLATLGLATPGLYWLAGMVARHEQAATAG